MSKIAVVSSAHGFGHATRDAVLCDTLTARGHAVIQFTHVPPNLLGANYQVEHAVVDVGLAQPNSLSEDLMLTVERLSERFSDAAIDSLANRLANFDLVVADIPPTAMLAARRANVPCLAMGNFDWAWIYGMYALADSEPQRAMSGWSSRLAAIQADVPVLSLAPGECGLESFAARIKGGMLARFLPAKTVAANGVLVCFGGLGLASVDALLPEIPGVTWILAPPMPELRRPDCVYIADIPFPALLSGAECVFTKPGYGIFAECLRAGARVVWLDRGRFPEATYLERDIAASGREKACSTSPTDISAAILRVLSAPRPPARATDDRDVITSLVAAVAADPARFDADWSSARKKTGGSRLPRERPDPRGAR